MENTLRASIVSAFNDGTEGGNPAGVVLNAQNLSSQEKQKIASRLGLSETAFVLPSTVADYKLEFYTPIKQIPDCGHATVAAFSLLKQKGLIKASKSSKETLNGVREIYFEGNEVYMEQAAPEYFRPPTTDQIQSALNIKLNFNELFPEIVKTENRFLIIPIQKKSDLAAIQPDFEKISKISKEHGLVGFYLFSLESMKPGRDATTRMFAPYFGVNEESATGMAAGPLAAYLYDRVGLKKTHFEIEQGHFMTNPAPSLLRGNLRLNSHQIEKIIIGGTGTILSEALIQT